MWKVTMALVLNLLNQSEIDLPFDSLLAVFKYVNS